MSLIWRPFGTLLASALLALPAAQPALDIPLPDAGAFLQRVKDVLRSDDGLERNFTYIEQRRDIKISRLGRVEVGPLRTFEVYPSSSPGETYKRLIAVDGLRLSPAELAKRDREHQQDVAKAAERERTETPAQRTARLTEQQKAVAEQRAIVEDALAVFDARLLRRERLDGHSVIVMALSARPDSRVSTREGRWMKQFEGTAWVSESDYQIVKLDMRAVDDVTIGWGIIGRVHRGSRLVFVRSKFEDVWLPAQVTFEATGRTLLLRKFQLSVVTTYSGYRKIS